MIHCIESVSWVASVQINTFVINQPLVPNYHLYQQAPLHHIEEVIVSAISPLQLRYFCLKQSRLDICAWKKETEV
uniref:Uncharacterized protein n=1 Tax=Setaria italica TaxID=4555 RepID=K4AHK1_SETIT